MAISEDRFCPGCGATHEPGAAFCAKCGRGLTGAAPTVAADAPAPPLAKFAPSLPAIAMAVGGVMVAVGAFLPWLAANIPFSGNLTRSGMEGGDGFMAIALGALTIVAAVAMLTRGNSAKWIALVLGIAGVALAIYEGATIQGRIADFNRQYPNYENLLTIGVGLYVIGVGGAITALSGLRMQRPVSAPTTQVQPVRFF